MTTIPIFDEYSAQAINVDEYGGVEGVVDEIGSFALYDDDDNLLSFKDLFFFYRYYDKDGNEVSDDVINLTIERVVLNKNNLPLLMKLLMGAASGKYGPELQTEEFILKGLRMAAEVMGDKDERVALEANVPSDQLNAALVNMFCNNIGIIIGYEDLKKTYMNLIKTILGPDEIVKTFMFLKLLCDFDANELFKDVIRLMAFKYPDSVDVLLFLSGSMQDVNEERKAALTESINEHIDNFNGSLRHYYNRINSLYGIETRV